MNSSYILSLFAVGVCLLATNTSAQAPAPAQGDGDNNVVNGSYYWVVKIAEEACKPGNHDDASTAKIFRCYFEIPRTEAFLGCQFKTFGHYLNNERNMDDFCNRWNETFVYYGCNQKAFADAGLSSELPAITEQLNICQAKVLKLGQFANQPKPQPSLAQLSQLLQGIIGQVGMGHGAGGWPWPMMGQQAAAPAPGRK